MGAKWIAKWPKGDEEAANGAPRQDAERLCFTGPGGTRAPAGQVVINLASGNPSRGTIGLQVGPSERQLAPGRCGGCLRSAAAGC